MLLVECSYPVLLSLGLVSLGLCAQGPGDWEAPDDDGWLQDNDTEELESKLVVQGWRDWSAPDEGWLLDNDVEPPRPRAADGRVALKSLVKALFGFKHLNIAKIQGSESVRRAKDVPELRKTSSEYDDLMMPATKSAESIPTPTHAHAHLYNTNTMEEDKSHRFTHSIRPGSGAVFHGSLL